MEQNKNIRKALFQMEPTTDIAKKIWSEKSEKEIPIFFPCIWVFTAYAISSKSSGDIFIPQFLQNKSLALEKRTFK